jgi:hypothetical protein
MTILVPHVDSKSFTDVELGSLVKVRDTQFHEHIGIRIKDVGGTPILVSLERDGEQAKATAIPPRPMGTRGGIPPNTRVLDFGKEWKTYAPPSVWSTSHTICNFGIEAAGTLLLADDGELGLAALVNTASGYVKFSDWTLYDHNAEHYIQTRGWNIALPGLGEKFVWPLGSAPQD